VPYIIENAIIRKENRIVENTMMVNGSRIVSLFQSAQKSALMKMDASPYVMTPTFAVLDTGFAETESYLELKDYFINHFLSKGCTILLTYVKVTSEKEIDVQLKLHKNLLINSPIDYVIGIRISIKQLTAAIIRKCKKDKLPAIFIEIGEKEDLDKVPWGWIREAMFPYNCPLIPVLDKVPPKKRSSILSEWHDRMKAERIPSLPQEICDNIPLSLSVLNKIGLLPERAGLLHGGELSYNLYEKNEKILNVDTKDLFLYHKERLLVTVHKGKVVMAGKDVLYKPGYGEHINVTTPSYFSY